MKPDTIYREDCAQILAYFPERSIDLIYVDPPFFSNKQYEIIWGNGYELRAFEDRWKGGIRNYIAWMEPKIRECHRVLKPTGSMYLHCDWHADAHLRLLMDGIFGENNFRNEIVWCYSRATSPRQKVWGRMHDILLFYTKSDDYTFNVDAVRLPYSKSSLAREGYKKMFHKKGDLKGGQCKLNKKGKFPEDWWQIPFIRPNAQERLGYPTQKPEKLLERIILASSNPMDIVLDPMCGCGTAIAVAHKLGRRWIGIDVSPTACKVMVRRMQKLGVKIAESDIIGLPKSVEELKVMPPFEFQNWVVQKLYGRPSKRKTVDFGVDGWLMNGRPMQIKRSEGIGRNVIDKFETAIRRKGKKAGIIIAFSFGKGAYEEVARAKLEEGLEIELKTVEQLLKET